MAELWAAVDAVVLGEILSSQTSGYQTTAGRPRVLTRHAVKTIEAFKTGREWSDGASEFRVLQSAGEIDVGDAIIKADGGYRLLAKGEQYVFFLKWNAYMSDYDLAYGPSAIFLLRNGQIESPASVALQRRYGYDRSTNSSPNSGR